MNDLFIGRTLGDKYTIIEQIGVLLWLLLALAVAVVFYLLITGLSRF